MRIALLTAIVLLLATACGEKAQSNSWFRITGEAGIGPSLNASDVDRSSAQATVDPATQAPTVVFGFTEAGRQKFGRLTAALARAGKRSSRPYHLAILVDGRAIERPYIDYRLYPAGIPGDNGVQLTLRRRGEAERLAKRLRRG